MCNVLNKKACSFAPTWFHRIPFRNVECYEKFAGDRWQIEVNPHYALVTKTLPGCFLGVSQTDGRAGGEPAAAAEAQGRTLPLPRYAVADAVEAASPWVVNVIAGLPGGERPSVSVYSVSSYSSFRDGGRGVLMFCVP